VLVEKIVPVSHFSPHIQYGLIWGRTATCWVTAGDNDRSVTRLCQVEFHLSYQNSNFPPVYSVINIYTSNGTYKQFHGCLFIYVVISLIVSGSISSCFKFLMCPLRNTFPFCHCAQRAHTSHCMVLTTRQYKQFIFLNAHFPVPHS
jgi:hypothetical protein